MVIVAGCVPAGPRNSLLTHLLMSTVCRCSRETSTRQKVSVPSLTSNVSHGSHLCLVAPGKNGPNSVDPPPSDSEATVAGAAVPMATRRKNVRILDHVTILKASSSLNGWSCTPSSQYPFAACIDHKLCNPAGETPNAAAQPELVKDMWSASPVSASCMTLRTAPPHTGLSKQALNMSSFRRSMAFRVDSASGFCDADLYEARSMGELGGALPCTFSVLSGEVDAAAFVRRHWFFRPLALNLTGPPTRHPNAGLGSSRSGTPSRPAEVLAAGEPPWCRRCLPFNGFPGAVPAHGSSF
mmetsp:Transcript_44074/g.116565  ORF Transcript_44074/g.116565 Transcript_44074/m.116565 type:complete len:297 (+) Transcript_44074:2362-3252(+)